MTERRLHIDELTTARQVIDWPSEQLILGHMPPVVSAGGRCPMITRISVQRICEPPQIWVDYADPETGQQWHLAFEDDWLDKTVNVRLR